ncbi:MAG: methylenetetrahydrofolate reductase, partial [bacterium]|nr:methylenetetrahydrofolate reductase [bacterium]
AAGIGVPIIPGLKVVGRKGLLTNIPRHFHVDLPDALIDAVQHARGAEEAAEAGVAHALAQARGLLEGGAPGLHFFVYNDAPLAGRVLGRLGI